MPTSTSLPPTSTSSPTSSLPCLPSSFSLPSLLTSPSSPSSPLSPSSPRSRSKSISISLSNVVTLISTRGHPIRYARRSRPKCRRRPIQSATSSAIFRGASIPKVVAIDFRETDGRFRSSTRPGWELEEGPPATGAWPARCLSSSRSFNRIVQWVGSCSRPRTNASFAADHSPSRAANVANLSISPMSSGQLSIAASRRPRASRPLGSCLDTVIARFFIDSSRSCWSCSVAPLTTRSFSRRVRKARSLLASSPERESAIAVW